MRRAFLPILVTTFLLMGPTLRGAGAATRADNDLARVSPQKKALAKKVYAHALELYLAKKYQQAASELRRAYAYAPLPSILFPLGLTYRELGHAEAARTAFESYLAKMPRASNRAQVEQLLADLPQEPVGAAGGATPAAARDDADTPAPVLASAQATAPAAADAAPPPVVAAEDSENPLTDAPRGARRSELARPVVTDREEPRSPYRWLKWGAAGTAVAAATVGVLVLQKASDQEATLRAAAAQGGNPPTRAFSPDLRALEDAFTTNRTWGAVALAGAATAAAASITFFVLDRRAAARARAHIAPMAASGFAGVAAGGSF